jgi:threonine/homoserine/homoserine lactone efflux protein
MTSLALATAILGLSPGPAVFATIARSLSLGLGRTYLFIAGIIFGDILFSLLAMRGLATLAARQSLIFTGLTMLGGGYLIYLGVQSLYHLKKGPEPPRNDSEKPTQLIVSGFLLTASNPKDLLFFVGFLPLFIDLTIANTGDMLLASSVIALSFLATLSLYAIAANYVRILFKSENIILWLHRIAGLLMMGVGIAVIFSKAIS